MKKVKVILSILCAVACLLTCAFVPSAQIKATAADTPTNLTEIYPSDFGFEDGIYTSTRVLSKYNGGDSLINTIFTMDWRFVDGYQVWFYYAAPTDWTGLSFRFIDGTFILTDQAAGTPFIKSTVTFDPEIAGVDFFGETVRIQISLEAVDNDADGNEDDLKIGVFFNYKLYGDEYIYTNDGVAAIGNAINIYPLPITKDADGNAYKAVTYEISSPKTENSDNALTVTPADFGITDGSINTTASTDIGFNGKNFKVNADLQTGDYIDYRGIKISRGNMGELTVSDSTGNGSFATTTVLPDESEALTPITYSDFGISDGTYTYAGNDIAVRKNYQNSTTLDNTYFSTKIKIHDGAGSSVAEIRHGGNDSGAGWTGIWCVFEAEKITVRNTKDNVNGYVFTPSNVGLTTFENTEFTFGISLRYIDADADALCDDVQYGIWVNGNLVQNKYAYVLDAVSIFGLKTAIYCSGSTDNADDSTLTIASVTSNSPVETQENGVTFPLKETCFEIFTLTDSDNLNATVFADGTQIADFTVSDYKDALTNNISVKGNIKSPEKEISYKSEVISFDDLGLVGGYKESAIGSYETELGTSKIISGYVTPKSNGSALISLTQDLTKIVSFSDFGIEDGGYASATAVSGKYGNDLINSIFTAKVKFANDNPVMYYAGSAENAGIKLKLTSKQLTIYDFSNTLIATIKASDTPLGTSNFQAREFLLGLAIGTDDTDGDGNTDDLKLAVWIAGEYYATYNIADGIANIGSCITLSSANTSKVTVSSCYALVDGNNLPFDTQTLTRDVLSYEIKDVDRVAFDMLLKATDLDDDGKKNDISVTYFVDGVATENRQYFIKDCVSDGNLTGIVAEITVTDATVYNRLPEDDLEESAVYSLHEAPYLLMGLGEIYVNREGGHYAGELIETAGEYVIVRNFLGKEYAQKIAIWQYGNAAGDETVSILDFIAAQKYIAGNSSSSVARKGADLDLDGNLTAKDIVALKRIILGIEELGTYTYETDKWHFTENVMPIVGYYGPLCQAINADGEIVDVNGVKAYDTVTDTVFKALAEAGINGISYIESGYSDTNKKTTLRTLELASKYGIGVTVNYGVSDDKTDVEFAQLLSKFSHYTAFKGLFIKDEPNTALLTDLAARSVRANKYSNIYGFTNLFPTYVSSESVPDYEAYVDQYCSTFGAKMISWDHYVMENYQVNYSNKNLAMQRYFYNLNVIRTAASKYEIPFWGFLQTGDANGLGESRIYTGTKEDMMWNLNTQLAYGAKGIEYFTLVQPNFYAYGDTTNPEFDYNAGGIIGANGQKTQYYDHAVAANAQIAAVDHVLLNSDSKDILAIGHYAKSHTGIDKSAYGSVIGVSTNETALLDLTYGAIVGCFDYNGKEAYYIVNYDLSDAHDITVTFNNAKTYTAYSTTLNGVAGSGSSYTASLGAGEAVLIVLD